MVIKKLGRYMVEVFFERVANRHSVESFLEIIDIKMYKDNKELNLFCLTENEEKILDILMEGV